MRQFLALLTIAFLAAGSVAAYGQDFRYSSQPTVSSADTETTESESGSEEASFETYDSATPQSLVQKKAMFRAEQRQLRLASRRWQGYSQSRPTVVSNPYMATYGFQPVATYRYATPAFGAGYWGVRNWGPRNRWYGGYWY